MNKKTMELIANKVMDSLKNTVDDNILKCETCGATVYEKIIFEKPERIAYLSDMSVLKQNTGDHRKQENICIDCFRNEIQKVAKTHKDKTKINLNVTTKKHIEGKE